jgi:hypothetical protein
LGFGISLEEGWDLGFGISLEEGWDLGFPRWGVFKSSDGDTWTEIRSRLSGQTSFALAIDLGARIGFYAEVDNDGVFKLWMEIQTDTF